MFVTLLMISGLGGFLSGLLGVGGAVVLIPLLYSAPPLAGVGQLSMHAVSGITMVQVLATSLLGYFAHGRRGHVHRDTVLSIGIPMGLFSLLGSLISHYVQAKVLLVTFGCLVIAALAMLLRKAPDESTDHASPPRFRLIGSLLVGSSVGLASGIVGAGGGFIVIPLMIRVLGIPMRIAVGSSLGIVFLGALLGAMGKAVTCQIEWVHVLPVLMGSLPGALAGAHMSHRLHPAYLRFLLLGVVLLAAINTWKAILTLP